MRTSLRKKIEKPFLAFWEARKSAKALTKRRKKFFDKFVGNSWSFVCKEKHIKHIIPM